MRMYAPFGRVWPAISVLLIVAIVVLGQTQATGFVPLPVLAARPIRPHPSGAEAIFPTLVRVVPLQGQPAGNPVAGLPTGLARVMQAASPPLGSVLGAAAFVDPQHGWIAGRGILATTDGGA